MGAELILLAGDKKGWKGFGADPEVEVFSRKRGGFSLRKLALQRKTRGLLTILLQIKMLSDRFLC